MAPLNEEQAAEIVRRYVEELKNADEPGAVSFVAITPSEVEELAAVMQTAAQVAEALAEERRTETSKDAARRRFRARAAGIVRELRAAGVPASPEPDAARSGGRWWHRMRIGLRLPGLAAGLGWACAAILAGILLMSRILPGSAPEVPDAGHAAVAASVQQLARNDVPAERARELWAHLVHCDLCFSAYRKAWHDVHGNAATAAAKVSAVPEPFYADVPAARVAFTGDPGSLR